jgi:hypothetical protein
LDLAKKLLKRAFANHLREDLLLAQILLRALLHRADTQRDGDHDEEAVETQHHATSDSVDRTDHEASDAEELAENEDGEG